MTSWSRRTNAPYKNERRIIRDFRHRVKLNFDQWYTAHIIDEVPLANNAGVIARKVETNGLGVDNSGVVRIADELHQAIVDQPGLKGYFVGRFMTYTTTFHTSNLDKVYNTPEYTYPNSPNMMICFKTRAEAMLFKLVMSV